MNKTDPAMDIEFSMIVSGAIILEVTVTYTFAVYTENSLRSNSESEHETIARALLLENDKLRQMLAKGCSLEIRGVAYPFLLSKHIMREVPFCSPHGETDCSDLLKKFYNEKLLKDLEKQVESLQATIAKLKNDTL